MSFKEEFKKIKRELKEATDNISGGISELLKEAGLTDDDARMAYEDAKKATKDFGANVVKKTNQTIDYAKETLSFNKKTDIEETEPTDIKLER